MDPSTFQRQHKLQAKHPQVFSSNQLQSGIDGDDYAKPDVFIHL